MSTKGELQGPALFYLDQRDLIALAKVQTGSPAASDLVDECRTLIGAIGSGAILCPMSVSHVLETWNIGNPKQRTDVAWAVIHASRRLALAPWHRVWRLEVEALATALGGTRGTEMPPVLGVGLAFANGFTDGDWTPPWPEDADSELIAFTEAQTLAEPSRHGLTPPDQERRDSWERWAAEASQQANALIDGRENFDEQDRLSAATLAMLHPEFIGALIGLDIHEVVLEQMRDAGPWSLVQHLPSLAVFTELHRLRYPNAARDFTPQDFHDLRYLSVALAYCDVVSADRFWADIAVRSDWLGTHAARVVTGRHAIGDGVKMIMDTEE
jgi:hypothetical protein